MKSNSPILQPEPRRIAWREAARHDDPALCLNVDHVFYPRGFAFPFHRHEYGEIVYVQAGRGYNHHNVGADEIQEGDLFFIAPDCVHYLSARTDTHLDFWNLAVPLERYQNLCARYEPWVWSLQAKPTIYHLDSGQRKWLESHIGQAQVPSCYRNPLRVDAFLLQACALANSSGPDQVPQWLQRIVDDIDNPSYLIGGVPEMVSASGRSREFFSRSCRRYFDASPQDLLIEARLRAAEYALRVGQDDLSRIAERCGYGSLTNFHRQFKRRHGLAPAAFRRRENAPPK